MKTLIVTTAVLVGIASPAFARSFNSDYGNISPLTYESGSHHTMRAIRRNRENVYAMARGAGAQVNPNSPALTGGGSVGYNSAIGNH
jgi:hypothetical protein